MSKIIAEKKINSGVDERIFLERMERAGYKWASDIKPTEWRPIRDSEFVIPYYIHIWSSKELTWRSISSPPEDW